MSFYRSRSQLLSRRRILAAVMTKATVAPSVALIPERKTNQPRFLEPFYIAQTRRKLPPGVEAADPTQSLSPSRKAHLEFIEEGSFTVDKRRRVPPAADTDEVSLSRVFGRLGLPVESESTYPTPKRRQAPRTETEQVRNSQVFFQRRLRSAFLLVAFWDTYSTPFDYQELDLRRRFVGWQKASTGEVAQVPGDLALSQQLAYELDLTQDRVFDIALSAERTFHLRLTNERSA